MGYESRISAGHALYKIVRKAIKSPARRGAGAGRYCGQLARGKPKSVVRLSRYNGDAPKCCQAYCVEQTFVITQQSLAPPDVQGRGNCAAPDWLHLAVNTAVLARLGQSRGRLSADQSRDLFVRPGRPSLRRTSLPRSPRSARSKPTYDPMPSTSGIHLKFSILPFRS